TEGESCIAVRVVARVGEDLRMHHSSPKDFDPACTTARAASFSPADEAVDAKLHSRFDKGEVIAAKRDSALFSENETCELCECSFQVGHADAVVNGETFNLRHHPFMRRIGGLEAIALPGDDDAYRWLRPLHDPD